MKRTDYSTTLSTRTGSSARLLAVLREFMIYHEFEVTALSEGGFTARKRRSLRKCQQPEGLIVFISELRVTPMGRELAVDAAFGWIRFISFMLIGISIISGGAMFIAMSQDPQVVGTPIRFLPFLIFGPLVLFAPLVTKDSKRRTTRALERMFKAAINIVELP